MLIESHLVFIDITSDVEVPSMENVVTADHQMRKIHPFLCCFFLFVVGCEKEEPSAKSQPIEFHQKAKGTLYVNGISFQSPHPDGGVELLYTTRESDFRKDIHTGFFSPSPFVLFLNLREDKIHLTAEFVDPSNNMVSKGYFGIVAPGDKVWIKNKQISVNDTIREARPIEELPELPSSQRAVSREQYKPPVWPTGWTGVAEESTRY